MYALARQPWEAAETGGDVFEGMIRGAEDFLKHTGEEPGGTWVSTCCRPARKPLLVGNNFAAVR